MRANGQSGGRAHRMAQPGGTHLDSPMVDGGADHSTMRLRNTDAMNGRRMAEGGRRWGVGVGEWWGREWKCFVVALPIISGVAKAGRLGHCFAIGPPTRAAPPSLPFRLRPTLSQPCQSSSAPPANLRPVISKHLHETLFWANLPATAPDSTDRTTRLVFGTASTFHITANVCRVLEGYKASLNRRYSLHWLKAPQPGYLIDCSRSYTLDLLYWPSSQGYLFFQSVLRSSALINILQLSDFTPRPCSCVHKTLAGCYRKGCHCCETNLFSPFRTQAELLPLPSSAWPRPSLQWQCRPAR